MEFASLFGSDRISSGTKLAVPESSLTEEQEKLFKGLDELGGDTSKYADAMNWFRLCKCPNEAMVLCIVVLDKPASYLFGGVKNEDTKRFMQVVPKVMERLEDLKAAGDSESQTNLQLLRLRDVLNSDDTIRIGKNGIEFIGDRKSPFDQMLARSMPLYTSNEIESFTKTQLENMQKVRMWWSGVFSLVNISRMKRVAMLYLEMCPKKKLNKHGVKWVNKHGGRPSTAIRLGNNDKTVEIMRDDIKMLLDNKPLWIHYKKTFSRALGPDYISNADLGLTIEQLEFVKKIKSAWHELRDVNVNGMEYEDEDPDVKGYQGDLDDPDLDGSIQTTGGSDSDVSNSGSSSEDSNSSNSSGSDDDDDDKYRGMSRDITNIVKDNDQETINFSVYGVNYDIAMYDEREKKIKKLKDIAEESEFTDHEAIKIEVDKIEEEYAKAKEILAEMRKKPLVTPKTQRDIEDEANIENTLKEVDEGLTLEEVPESKTPEITLDDIQEEENSVEYVQTMHDLHEAPALGSMFNMIMEPSTPKKILDE